MTPPAVRKDEAYQYWGAKFQQLAATLAALKTKPAITLRYGGGLLNYGAEIADQVFRRRWADGKRLSARIWDFAKTTEEDLIGRVNAGIAQGMSAEDIGRSIREFLVDAQPGPYSRGMTPRKRALRLARTETNQAYKAAHEMLAQQSDIVKGVWLVRSANGDPDCPICAELVGQVGAAPPGDRTLYPVGGVPDTHPNCLCHEEDELIDPSELP